MSVPASHISQEPSQDGAVHYPTLGRKQSCVELAWITVFLRPRATPPPLAQAGKFQRFLPGWDILSIKIATAQP